MTGLTWLTWLTGGVGGLHPPFGGKGLDGVMGRILVTLKAGHPTGTMLTRLASGEVVAVTAMGVWLDDGALVAEEIAHGWFAVERVEDVAERIADKVMKGVVKGKRGRPGLADTKKVRRV